MKKCFTLVSIFAMTLLISACSSKEWQVTATPSEKAVEAALDNIPDTAMLRDINLPEDAVLSLPASVRPCCAFGNDQRVQVGSMPIPFYRHANTVDLESIGAHSFDAGSFSYQKSSPDSSKSTENNGVIYTLKGGFIDLAHIRDTADNTVALFYQIYPNLGKQHTVDLPFEIGNKSIEIESFDVSGLSPSERWELAAAMAARLGYFMAESHEIAQWHGYRSFALWSEAVSAYSIEDLYSNMLGAKIAQAIITNHLAMTRQQFNYHMTTWIFATIDWLEPVTVKETNALFDIVDGYWWDSAVPMPNKYMLLKRHYALGDVQAPYLVPVSLAKQSPQWEQVSNLYQQDEQIHQLSLASESHGIKLDDVAKLYLEVDEKFATSFSHIPTNVWQQGFNHTRFIEITNYNQDYDTKELSEHLQKHPHLPLATKYGSEEDTAQ